MATEYDAALSPDVSDEQRISDEEWRQINVERWRVAVTAKAGQYEAGLMRRARLRRTRETHRFRTWLALRIAPWLA